MPTDKRLRQKEREQAARAARAAEYARARRHRNIIIGAVAIVGVFAFAFVYSTVRGGDDDTDVATDTTFPPETEMPETTTEGDNSATPTTFPLADPVDPECPPVDGAAERITQFTEAPPMCLEDGATYQAVFETDAGDITVDLDTENTPNTVNNFVFLARWGYYDGTVFMRSNTGIEILQGGAPHTQDNADPGPGYDLLDEGEGFNYQTGDLVMARQDRPNGAGAQFFFGTGPGIDRLSPGPYVTFGRVVDGLDVLEAIMATHVGSTDRPDEGAPDPLPVVNTIRIIQS